MKEGGNGGIIELDELAIEADGAKVAWRAAGFAWDGEGLGRH